MHGNSFEISSKGKHIFYETEKTISRRVLDSSMVASQDGFEIDERRFHATQ